MEEDVHGEGKLGGTMEAELVAREEKRRQIKPEHEQMNDEL